MKAERSGAPLAVVAMLPPAFSAATSFNGKSDSKAGNARHAPTPRKNWRRLNAAQREEFLLGF
jgi:hypothetical protein